MLFEAYIQVKLTATKCTMKKEEQLKTQWMNYENISRYSTFSNCYNSIDSFLLSSPGKRTKKEQKEGWWKQLFLKSFEKVIPALKSQNLKNCR